MYQQPWQFMREDRRTLQEFLNRPARSGKPGYISDNRWRAMEAWFASRLLESHENIQLPQEPIVP